MIASPFVVEECPHHWQDLSEQLKVEDMLYIPRECCPAGTIVFSVRVRTALLRCPSARTGSACPPTDVQQCSDCLDGSFYVGVVAQLFGLFIELA